MHDEVVEAESVELPDGSGGEGEALEAEVRPLPERRSAAELDAWRGEIRTVAAAAAGGLAAGAATVAAVNAIKGKVAARRGPTRVLRRGGREDQVLATRSFLIDVHILDR